MKDTPTGASPACPESCECEYVCRLSRPYPLPPDIAGLVERLKFVSRVCDEEKCPNTGACCTEAADALESLAARVADLAAECRAWREAMANSAIGEKSYFQQHLREAASQRMLAIDAARAKVGELKEPA